MKQTTRPADIYLRFLQLADALRGLPSLPSLDPLEERILDLVARTYQTQERLSVRDMMAKSELGSPAMLHSRLKSMREKGWIMLGDTEDARRKQIELTQAALLHFDKLSKCLIQATKSISSEKLSSLSAAACLRIASRTSKFANPIRQNFNQSSIFQVSHKHRDPGHDRR